MTVQEELTLLKTRTGVSVLAAVRVGLSAPHFGNAPQQAVAVICEVTGISCGLSPSSQEQALSPVSQLRA